MSRVLASVTLAMLVLTVAMGLKTVVTTHADGSNGVTPVLTLKNGPDPLPAPWKNGPDPLPAPWKSGR
jgi:hypothetical protein